MVVGAGLWMEFPHVHLPAAGRTGMNYMMGETTCYRPETIYCRRKAAAGEFGHFCYAEGHYFHDMEHNLYNVAKWRWGDKWTDSKRGNVPTSAVMPIFVSCKIKNASSVA